MTKTGLAKQILRTVDNVRELDNSDEDQVIEQIEIMLGCLIPKNFERFAQWGMPEDQVDISKCWPLVD
jgi:hypothetical protein